MANENCHRVSLIFKVLIDQFVCHRKRTSSGFSLWGSRNWGRLILACLCLAESSRIRRNVQIDVRRNAGSLPCSWMISLRRFRDSFGNRRPSRRETSVIFKNATPLAEASFAASSHYICKSPTREPYSRRGGCHTPRPLFL